MANAGKPKSKPALAIKPPPPAANVDAFVSSGVVAAPVALTTPPSDPAPPVSASPLAHPPPSSTPTSRASSAPAAPAVERPAVMVPAGGRKVPAEGLRRGEVARAGGQAKRRIAAYLDPDQAQAVVIECARLGIDLSTAASQAFAMWLQAITPDRPTRD